MSNCPGSTPPADTVEVFPIDSVDDDGADIGEFAALWAVLNVVEAGATEGDGEVAEIRRGFNRVLAEHALAPADLFEFIVEHFEQEDWGSLGLSHVEAEVERAVMRKATRTYPEICPEVP